MNPVITTVRYKEFPAPEREVKSGAPSNGDMSYHAGSVPDIRDAGSNFILIRGGALPTCEDIVRAADERHIKRFKELLLGTAFFWGAFILIELVLHCDEVFK